MDHLTGGYEDSPRCPDGAKTEAETTLNAALAACAPGVASTGHLCVCAPRFDHQAATVEGKGGATVKQAAGEVPPSSGAGASDPAAGSQGEASNEGGGMDEMAFASLSHTALRVFQLLKCEPSQVTFIGDRGETRGTWASVSEWQRAVDAEQERAKELTEGTDMKEWSITYVLALVVGQVLQVSVALAGCGFRPSCMTGAPGIDLLQLPPSYIADAVLWQGC